HGRPRLDHEHELRARLVAVDDRRRVLGLGRDVAHRRWDIGLAAVAAHGEVAAGLEPANDGLGNEEAHLYVLRREAADHPRSRPGPLSPPAERGVAAVSP